jgi:hypothetical protein
MSKRIEIPGEFMGVPVSKETLKEALEKEPVPRPAPIVPTPRSQGNTSKPAYLLLEGRTHGNYEYPDLIVATDRSHQNKNWSEAWNELRQEDAFMLNPRQYVDFLKMLRSGQGYDETGNAVSGSVLAEILNDIVEVRDPWRAEWLDARFSNKRTGRKELVIPVNQMHITYHVLDNGSLREVAEPLDNYLGSDKTPGIDLNSWLSDNEHGLPKQNIQDGQLYFWHPRTERVARFGANSDWAYLGCGGGSGYHDSSLGVRVARAKN